VTETKNEIGSFTHVNCNKLLYWSTFREFCVKSWHHSVVTCNLQRSNVLRFTNYQNQLLKRCVLSDILVGLLGRGIGQSYGLYLHRTAQHRKPRIHIHASRGIETHNPRVWPVQDHVRLETKQSFILDLRVFNLGVDGKIMLEWILAK
jgi:hypothetical protein